MQGKILLFIFALAISTLSVAGCGGGGGGGGGTTPVVSTVNKGVITASGNIAVNGVFYNISSANIMIDGLPGNRSGLQVGMVVTVKGIFDNRTSHAIRRTASSVEYTSSFQGPVDCVNILNNTLTVMGQQVLISTIRPNQTVFANFSSSRMIFANESTVTKLNPHLSPLFPPNPPTPLNPQTPLYNIVKISGFSNDVYGFQATRIELLAQAVDLTTSFPIEIMGTANNVDPIGMSFTIGNMSLDYSQMNPVYVPIHFASGQFVKVKEFSSNFSPGNAPSLTILAPQSIIAINEGAAAQEGDYVTVTGYVSGLFGTFFNVGGTPVKAGTISLSGVTNSVMATVSGTIQNGILTATKISLN